MKECIHCSTLIDDDLMDCPKCHKSWFHKSTKPNKYSLEPDQLIEYVIQEAGIKFTEIEKESFKKFVIKSCKTNNIEINQKNLSYFIKHLREYA